MDKNYSEKVKENALFHYTSAKGLKGIIESDSIWASSYHCTNDLLEFKGALRLLKREIKKRVLIQLKTSTDTNSMYTSQDLGMIFEDAISKAQQDIDGFITSFCYTKDDEVYINGLLSQWRSYGLDGGYLIEFDKAKLLTELKQSMTSFSLGEVKYDINENAYLRDFTEKYIKYFFSNFPKNTHRDKSKKKTLLDLYNNTQGLDKWKKMMITEKLTNALAGKGNLTNMHKDFLKLLAFTKSSHFEEENEHRLVFHVKDLKNNVGTFEKNGLIVPYYKPPIKIHSCVKRIIIGPSPRINERQKSVEMMLKPYNMNDVNVVRSEITYDKG